MTLLNKYGNLSFTKLDIWKEAHRLTLEVYDITAEWPKEERFGLTSQGRRAAVSVELCIAEGSGRYYHKDVVRFMYSARSSIKETQNVLVLGVDLGYSKKNDVNHVISDYTGLEIGINNFIAYRRQRAKRDKR